MRSKTALRILQIVDVKSIRSGLDQRDLGYSVELAAQYMNVAKFEMVLPEDRVEQAREIILKAAHTGRKGDGLIYVSQVDEAIHIRTGKASA